MMRRERAAGINSGSHYTVLFFSAYFIYYAAYCIFSSYTVLFLTERAYSATVCGIITSLTFLANLLMEPVGGYITDTFLPTRRYLLLLIGMISALCIFCTKYMDQPWIMLPGMVLSAGIVYPFSQLMDAWVNISREKQPDLIYSRVRAGGSIGYAVMSVIGGYYFKHRGWDGYFLVQMVIFLFMIPCLLLLPDTSLGNCRKQEEKEKSLSFFQAFHTLVQNRRFLFWLGIITFYWFSHRLVGSFLSLIIVELGGDAETYGNVCGAGAAVEFAGLMLLAFAWKKKNSHALLGMAIALITNLLRPLCFLLFSGTWALYLGQMLQCASFAFYMSVSVECFAEAADERLRSFSISMGLTVSSVVGTVLANLVGGRLCDMFHPGILILVSFALGFLNSAVFFAERLYHSMEKHG